jgi:hypothetical protein
MEEFLLCRISHIQQINDKDVPVSDLIYTDSTRPSLQCSSAHALLQEMQLLLQESIRNAAVLRRFSRSTAALPANHFLYIHSEDLNVRI